MSLTFELDSDLLVVDRNIITLLDALSNVGGLKHLIFAVFSLLMIPLNHTNLETPLAAQLYDR